MITPRLTRDDTRPAPRTGGRWPRALPALARHLTRTMPWGPLLGGCLAGLALLAFLAYVADRSHSPLDQTQVRLTFVPALAGLAFVARTPVRSLAVAAPTPAWVTPAIQLLLAGPVLAATVAIQLGLMAHTSPRGTTLPAIYPLLAQLTGWAALVVTSAAVCDRSRYADLSGAVAGPVGLAVIAVGWFTPGLTRLLVPPAASGRAATVSWYLITAVGLVLTGAALRDPWHRYVRTRRSRRGVPAPAPAGSSARLR
jgi:membrane-associated HD superfamily phosphohydrolase